MAVQKIVLSSLLAVLVVSHEATLSQQRSAITPNHSGFPIGVWEAAQPDGSIVGINLATIPGDEPDAVLPQGETRQEGPRLQIGVFQKKHQKIVCGEENFFIVGWTGARASDALVSYANQKLEIHYHDEVNHSEIHVELVLDGIRDVWEGHFHRERFDGKVVLHRTSDSPDPAQGGCFTTVSRPRPPSRGAL